jgi:hypothetical protein
LRRANAGRVRGWRRANAGWREGGGARTPDGHEGGGVMNRGPAMGDRRKKKKMRVI